MFLTYYCFSILICLPVLVWGTWYIGQDIMSVDLIMLVIISSIPFANVLISIVAILAIIASHGNVILKGRS